MAESRIKESRTKRTKRKGRGPRKRKEARR
jgi:hypothetical protein